MATDNIIYDSYSNYYDRILLNWKPYSDLMELHDSTVNENDFVLDMGTGTGNLAKMIINKAYRMIVHDVNDKMMSFISDKIRGYEFKLSKFVMNAEELAFGDETFDSIVSMNVIYNLKNPEKAMGEAYRTLKKGGVFSISGPLVNADAEFIAENIKQTMIVKGLYQDEGIRESVKSILNTNRKLVRQATLYTNNQLENILIDRVGFNEVIKSTDDVYFNNAYFVAVRK